MAKVLKGTVVSDKNDKTIVISVVTRKVHPIYKKAYTTSKKIHAHDEDNKAVMDDIVLISEVKPISKKKRFTLKEIVGSAGIKHVEADDNKKDEEA